MKFLHLLSAAVVAGLCACVPLSSHATRVTEDFDIHWLFSRGDFASAMISAFDDHGWRLLNVPHDWSSEGPFSP